MEQLRLNFETNCNHCGNIGNIWLWEAEVEGARIVCGNCQFPDVVLVRVLEEHVIDPLKPKNKQPDQTMT